MYKFLSYVVWGARPLARGARRRFPVRPGSVRQRARDYLPLSAVSDTDSLTRGVGGPALSSRPGLLRSLSEMHTCPGGTSSKRDAGVAGPGEVAEPTGSAVAAASGRHHRRLARRDVRQDRPVDLQVRLHQVEGRKGQPLSQRDVGELAGL